MDAGVPGLRDWRGPALTRVRRGTNSSTTNSSAHRPGDAESALIRATAGQDGYATFKPPAGGPAHTRRASSADGTGTTTYHDRKYSPTVNGNSVAPRSSTEGHIPRRIQNGLILFSNLKDHGTSTLPGNGACNNGGPLTIVTTPERFSRSGNTLREYPSNGSVVSRRAPVGLPVRRPAADSSSR
jgi:hypothetical protein